MFVFGHVGIGKAIASPFGRALPLMPLIVGTLLPDVIDKPLYHAHISTFVSCTRTFGHTGLFLAAILAVAMITRSRTWLALGVGVCTHAVLDGLLDSFNGERSSTLVAFAWPFLDTHFFTYGFKSPFDQLKQLWKAPIIAGEVVGLLLLTREYLKRRRPAPVPRRTG